MKANFHTHTFRCHHAGCSDQRYVDVALEAGITTLGFSDHSPYVGFDGDYYSFYRMSPDELSEYVQSVKDLREQYKGKIDIHLGLETEYYPRLFEGLLEFLKPYGIEYMILGQHFLDDDQYGISVHHITEEAQLVKYADQCIEGLKTGVFSYLAHPDIPKFDQSSPVFRREMERLCRASNDLGLPVELNILGIHGGRHYPCEEYLKVVKECDSTVILGVDAHLPDQFLHRESIDRAYELIDKYDLRVTESIDMTGMRRYYETNT